MTKRIIAVLLTSVVLLSGCGDRPRTQKDCIVEGRFKYNGKCVHFHNVPEDKQDDVILEVADEIAEENNISRYKALEMIFDSLRQNKR